jgi:hypothetical protein
MRPIIRRRPVRSLLLISSIAVVVVLPAMSSQSVQANVDQSARPATSYGIKTTHTTNTIWIRAHSVRLSLTLPRGHFPVDALVKVRTVMQNVGKRTVAFDPALILPPGQSAPQPEVTDTAGTILFPPSMATFPPLPLPIPIPYPLNPGQTIKQTLWIVLRGPLVRITASIRRWNPKAPVAPKPHIVTSHPIRFHLLPSDAPATRLTSASPSLELHVSRPAYAHGLPLSIHYADCGFPSYDFQYVWTPAPRLLKPGCGPLLHWTVLVGWPNHSIATVNYQGTTTSLRLLRDPAEVSHVRSVHSRR